MKILKHRIYTKTIEELCITISKKDIFLGSCLRSLLYILLIYHIRINIELTIIKNLL